MRLKARINVSLGSRDRRQIEHQRRFDTDIYPTLKFFSCSSFKDVQSLRTHSPWTLGSNLGSLKLLFRKISFFAAVNSRPRWLESANLSFLSCRKDTDTGSSSRSLSEHDAIIPHKMKHSMVEWKENYVRQSQNMHLRQSTVDKIVRCQNHLS